MISASRVSGHAEVPALRSRDDKRNSDLESRPTLNEIQIRAYRVHRKHGELGGGYTLDDRLEAEHELDEEALQKKAGLPDRSVTNRV